MPQERGCNCWFAQVSWVGGRGYEVGSPLAAGYANAISRADPGRHSDRQVVPEIDGCVVPAQLTILSPSIGTAYSGEFNSDFPSEHAKFLTSYIYGNEIASEPCKT